MLLVSASMMATLMSARFAEFSPVSPFLPSISAEVEAWDFNTGSGSLFSTIRALDNESYFYPIISRVKDGASCCILGALGTGALARLTGEPRGDASTRGIFKTSLGNTRRPLRALVENYARSSASVYEHPSASSPGARK